MKKFVSISVALSTIVLMGGMALVPLTASAQTNLPIASSQDIGSPDYLIRAAAVKGSYAYIARGKATTRADVTPTSDLQLWDISNPAAPTLVSTIAHCIRDGNIPEGYTLPTDSACNVFALKVVGNYLFMANYGANTIGGAGLIRGSISIYDVSNPGSPVLADFVQTNGGELGIGVMDISLGADGKYYIIGAVIGEVPRSYQLWTFDPSAAAGSRLVYRNAVFITASSGYPVIRSVTFVPGTAYAVGVDFESGPAAYMHTLSVVQGPYPYIYLAATNQLPLASGYLPMQGTMTSVGTKTYLGVTNGTLADQLLVLDTTNPSSPTIQGSVDIPNTVSGRAINGYTATIGNNFVIVTAGQQVATPNGALYTIDTSNPTAPVVVGETVEGQWMYTNGTLGLDTVRGTVVIPDAAIASNTPTIVPSGKMAIVDISAVAPTPSPSPSSTPLPGDVYDTVNNGILKMAPGQKAVFRPPAVFNGGVAGAGDNEISIVENVQVDGSMKNIGVLHLTEGSTLTITGALEIVGKLLIDRGATLVVGGKLTCPGATDITVGSDTTLDIGNNQCVQLVARGGSGDSWMVYAVLALAAGFGVGVFLKVKKVI